MSQKQISRPNQNEKKKDSERPFITKGKIPERKFTLTEVSELMKESSALREQVRTEHCAECFPDG